jgi:hypothetical protein
MQASDLRQIWMSAPILNGPLTARRDTPQAFRDGITAFHLALPAAFPGTDQQVEKGGARAASGSSTPISRSSSTFGGTRPRAAASGADGPTASGADLTPRRDRSG